MDFDNDLLLWIFGIAIAIALLGGSGRRRRWRRSRRKANRSTAGGQRRDELVPVGVVAPAEAHLLGVEVDEAVVGDGGLVGVAPEV